MEMLRVQQLETHYRLPRRLLDQRGRLDRVHQLLRDEFFELALHRIGLAADEVLCIRELRMPLRLPWARPDRELALTWSMALADAIHRAKRNGDSEWVVAYRSQVHALIDCITSLSRGDLTRAWAWRIVGLVSESALAANAPRLWQQILLRHPSAIVPVLRAAAEQGGFPRLARHGSGGLWLELARSAVTAVGGSTAAIPSDLPPRAYADRLLAGEASVSRRSDGHDPHPMERGLRASLERSALARAMVREFTTDRADSALQWAMGVLACLDIAPSLLRGGEDTVASRLQAALRILLARGESVPIRESASTRATQHDSPIADASDRDSGRIAEAESERSTHPERPLRGDRLTDIRSAFGTGKDFRMRDTTPGSSPSVSTQKLHEAAGPSDNADVDQQRPGGTDGGGYDESSDVVFSPYLPPKRMRASTDCGGLLFLVHILDELRFLEEVGESPALRHRLPRWVLHQLGLVLSLTHDDDPAVLAWAGLAPDGSPPSRDETPPVPDERQELAMWSARISEALWLRLGRPDRRGASLVAWIIQRRAEIVADPGWIQVHFSMDDADTTIRRAGLDLDPGFVPWLGVVLKFVYESQSARGRTWQT